MSQAGSKTCIAFYSRAGENYFGGSIKNIPIGNTKVVAQILQKITGGDLCEIISKDYPENYTKCTEVAKEDLHNNIRPEIKLKVNDSIVSDFSINQYDTLYIGNPCWWGTAPMPVFTFLEKYVNQYSGPCLNLHPFITHEGSGLGSDVTDITKSVGSNKNIKINKGLAISGSSCNNCQDKLQKWVKSF